MTTIYSERLYAPFERELGPCADELGIPRAIFHRPDVEFSVENHYRLLECAARATNPHIGLTMGQTLRISDLGALGYATLAAPNIGHGLQLLATYADVLAHANTIRLDVGKDVFVFSYRLVDRHITLHQQDVELALCLIAKTVRDLSERRLNPTRVEFERPRPDYHQKLQTHFGCEVRYERGGNRLQYPCTVLKVPTKSAEPSLLHALEFYLADRLILRSQGDDLLGKVNHLIATSLSEGMPEIDKIASRLGLSRRTLQRRLSDSGEVFSDMVDSVRRDIATEYVQHSDHSLTDIALMLGYGELSSFSRAFRRLTGISAQQLRDGSS